jgi:hypothetical protein
MSTITIRTVFLTFVGLFFLAVDGNAQKGYFRDTVIKDGLGFNFHIFSHGPENRVSTRINRLLQLEELYSLAKPPYSSRMFDQSRVNDGSIYGGKTSIEAKVFSNNRRILSLGFIESSSGATTHYWHKYYTFNSGNGDRIELRDLFTKAGYKNFFRSALKIRSSKYRREVRKKIEPQFQESFLETLSCFENDDVMDFYVRNGRIIIDGDSCLIKNQKFDGLNMEVTIGSKSFKKYLNPYGRAAFGFSTSDISRFRSTELPQLFEGSVNGLHRFVIVLNPGFGDDYWGMYAYLRYGEGIALRGSITENGLKLTEYILSPTTVDGPMGEIRKTQEIGTISGRLTTQAFEGIWSDKEKAKSLPFYASVR